MSPPTDESLEVEAGPEEGGKRRRLRTKEEIRRGWIVPAIIGCALMMQTLNATSINNALPAMADAFGVEPLRLNVAITMYLLAAAVFLPVSGWLADRFGARRIFLTAMVLYSVSSAACGFAQDLPQLIAARLLQGMAGALLMPVGRLVLLRTTPKTELLGAMSVVTMPALVGPVIGPVLGGAIVTFVSWRWIFFLNIPIAIATFFLVRAFVPNVKAQEAGPLDGLGMLLTGAGLAGLIFGFEMMGRDVLPPGVVAALFAAGLVSLGLYAAHAKRTPHAVVDLSLFRLQTFRASVVGGAFFRIMPGGTPFLLAMLLQVGFGMSAFTAGLLTFVSAAGALLMKATAPPILRRYGFRSVLLVNGVICAVTFMAYALFRPDTPSWLMMLVLGVSGFFRSLQFTSLNAMAYADLEQDRMSRGTTTASIVQQFMQSVGIGLAATLLHFLMILRGEETLTWQAVAPAFLILGAVTLISLYWFIRMPPDAGDEMNARRAA